MLARKMLKSETLLLFYNAISFQVRWRRQTDFQNDSQGGDSMEILSVGEVLAGCLALLLLSMIGGLLLVVAWKVGGGWISKRISGQTTYKSRKGFKLIKGERES
jgi:hypothetical protein